ncbi:MAG: hypothetical protein P8M19_00290 [Crocinitomicaceae bacterium]|nr:hypothetical protein [Crocinitomicaceae bacterium]MDG1658085.1 hypothetical protein [Crocinitomicaceae bacterium]MDG2440079.1 hypothetical protein [Crocinitomicaceae bacterium]
MESWIRRLKFYGVGFGIGLLFVFIFFQNRGCSWLPENRVKNSILDRLLVVSDETAEILKKRGVNKKELIQFLNVGDVIFGESEKDKDDKVYVIEKDGKKYLFTLPFESFIAEVQLGNKASEAKTSTEGCGQIWRYPNDSTLVYPDSTALVTCQQDYLGLVNPMDILKELKKTGRIDFAKSDLTITPKPEHYLMFERDDKEIGMKMIWYKNKLNLQSFVIPDSTNCE